MRIIPEELTGNKRSLKMYECVIKMLAMCAIDAAPDEIGANFSHGLISEMKKFGETTPRRYRLHSHVDGIAFPSEGDLDVIVERMGAGVDHHILAIRPDKKRAVLRSYNCPFGLERTLINVDGKLCSEVRFNNGELEYIYQDKENVFDIIKSMEEFLGVRMPEDYLEFLRK